MQRLSRSNRMLWAVAALMIAVVVIDSWFDRADAATVTPACGPTVKRNTNGPNTPAGPQSWRSAAI